MLYATGSMASVVLKAADGDACLAKPYRPADLLRSLEIVTEMVASATILPPFPKGFELLHSPAALHRQCLRGG